MPLLQMRLFPSHKFLISWYGIMKLFQMFCEINTIVILLMLRFEIVDALSKYGRRMLILHSMLYLFFNFCVVAFRVYFRVDLRIVLSYEILLASASIIMVFNVYLDILKALNPFEPVVLLFIPVNVYCFQILTFIFLKKRLYKEKVWMELSRYNSLRSSRREEQASLLNQENQDDYEEVSPLLQFPPQYQVKNEEEVKPDVPIMKINFEMLTEKQTRFFMQREVTDCGTGGSRVSTHLEITTTDGSNVLKTKEAFVNRKSWRNAALLRALGMPNDIVQFAHER